MTKPQILQTTLLGAGQEVGRSCIVLQYQGKTVVCDTGIHLAHAGMAALPFIDQLDWSTVDVILITHFHLDHVGALTYVMEKTNFRDGRGKVYMTHPTKAVYKLMMQDLLRTDLSSLSALFKSADVAQSLSPVIPVSVHQQVTPCPGVTFTAYHAGHVLGACMYLINIAGLKILYTGDYSREEDHHLVKAEIPPVRPDVLIVESTHGVLTFEPRHLKEIRFTNLVHAIIRRGGHVLLPVFALGTAQELMLVLEGYWEDHPELKAVDIYYTSGLARKCMAVYQANVNTMNDHIRERFARRENPFVFKHVSRVPSQRDWVRRIARGPPCVVLASPGFMESGTSRELLELWAPDPRNGLIVTGYSVEGTLARTILNEPEEIPSLKGTPIPRKMSINAISFSAHVDYSQNSEFIELVDAEHVIMVHGEQTAMGRLRVAMEARYKDRGIDRKIHTPRNLETLELSFQNKNIAEVVGSLANTMSGESDVFTGLIVANGGSYKLLDARDLQEFTTLPVSVVTQKQRLVLNAAWELVRWHLEGMFGKVEERLEGDQVKTINVMNTLEVKHTAEHEVTLEWESSATNDMIADAALVLLSGIDKSPASVKLTSQGCLHAHPHADSHTRLPLTRSERLVWFLEAHFGNVKWCVSDGQNNDGHMGEDPLLIVHIEGEEVRVNPATWGVTCVDDPLQRHVEGILDVAKVTVWSLDEHCMS